jgi:lariat debranching enzyme
MTVFIGGNHEASDYLRELYFGGWVAPNIYFLGNSGVINVTKENARTLRIGGISGIFKPYSFFQMYGNLPIREDTKKNCYHVREIETFKLSLLDSQKTIDIFLGHDWPRGITKHGSAEEQGRLFKIKPFFKKDIQSGSFGSPALTFLMEKLKIDNVLVGHCHIQFNAKVYSVKQTGNIDENRFIQFSAVDKCLKHRKFLKFVEFDAHNHLQDVDR